MKKILFFKNCFQFPIPWTYRRIRETTNQLSLALAMLYQLWYSGLEIEHFCIQYNTTYTVSSIHYIYCIQYNTTYTVSSIHYIYCIQYTLHILYPVYTTYTVSSIKRALLQRRVWLGINILYMICLSYVFLLHMPGTAWNFTYCDSVNKLIVPWNAFFI